MNIYEKLMSTCWEGKNVSTRRTLSRDSGLAICETRFHFDEGINRRNFGFTFLLLVGMNLKNFGVEQRTGFGRMGERKTSSLANRGLFKELKHGYVRCT